MNFLTPKTAESTILPDADLYQNLSKNLMYYENMKLKINSNFKYGFTLAEVLIALVIVGVVAALVISPLINTYVENSTVAKVKKGLSILGQAKKLAEVQNGPIEGWDFGEGETPENAAQFWSYLKPHISVAKDCGCNSDCYSSTVKKIQGGDVDYSRSQYYHFILQDGSVMWFRMAQANVRFMMNIRLIMNALLV